MCAVHCALLPLAIALLPLLGLGLLGSEGFERGFLVFALLLGVGNLGRSFRQHRDITALLWLIPGLASVAAGVLVPAIHGSPLWHAVLMASGGLLIAVAHLVNLRVMRGDIRNLHQAPD